jgi:hypothetical protein
MSQLMVTAMLGLLGADRTLGRDSSPRGETDKSIRYMIY